MADCGLLKARGKEFQEGGGDQWDGVFKRSPSLGNARLWGIPESRLRDATKGTQQGVQKRVGDGREEVPLS